MAGQNGHGDPNLNDGLISIIDMKTWKTIKHIRTRGPGFFMRSHENSRYAWIDSMMSKEFKDTMQVIDKETLEVVAELKPEPGKTFATSNSPAMANTCWPACGKRTAPSSSTR
jgi:hypothetical protein